MTHLSHEAISASAGSGKTYALAHRYIRLLASGVPADRIIALTFSRKAAGEIFDSIVNHLCSAAADAGSAGHTSRDARIPLTEPAGFMALLRGFLDGLHRVRIGTLDSFIIGVVRAFPVELGVPVNFRVLDSDSTSAAELRGRALARLYNPRITHRCAQIEFLEAFKQATFGREEKDLAARLDSFVERHRNHYRALPEASAWGAESAVWPGGSPWLEKKADPERAADALSAYLAAADLDDKIVARWETFLSAARSFGPGAPWIRDIEYLFEKLVAIAGDLHAGEG
jgi:ATP-dependent helicase/nuclease subunit A